MSESEIERLQQELARERAARAELEARSREVERELTAVTDELRRSVAAFQDMALRHQQALVRLAGVGPGEAGLASLQHELTRIAADTVGVERASVWVLNPAGTELCCEALYERSADRFSDGIVLAAADYPRYFEALKRGRAIDAHDAQSDPRTSEFTVAYLEPLGITSMLDAAIRLEGRVAGVVCLEHIGPARTWNTAEVEFAGALADQAALGLAAVQRRRMEKDRAKERAKLRSELRQTRAMALQDELTGLPNRRALEAMLDEEVARALRHRRPLSIMMIDVDHFKNINDTHGHPAGDAVLRELARLLGDQLRSIDKAARYGGEELLVILPETPLDEARNAAERVRMAIEAHTFMVDPEDDEPAIPLRLTASAGVASLPENADNLERLIEVADRALYDAKHQGRNRIVAAATIALRTA